jgi:hypothetical protein
MTSEIKVDTISENTSANGVTIDGLTIKDGNIIGDVALAGTTPTFTIGDAGAEDAALIFDGNALDYYIALDDSADNLIIGSGSTVGSNSLITIDSDGDFTLDSAGDIILDADGGDIFIKDGGTQIGSISNAGSNNFQIASSISNGDLLFKGNDGGAVITALTLDMSEAGRANFNNDIGLSDDRGLRLGSGDDSVIYNDGSNLYIKNGTLNQDIIFQGNDDGSTGTTALTLDMSDAGTAKFNHNIKAVTDDGFISSGASDDLIMFHDGTDSKIFNSTGDMIIDSADSDKDLIFKGSDGGSVITALTLDMSAAGLAIFNAGLAIGGTGAANTLDDYEEGTFTPSFSGTSSAPSGVNYNARNGSYTKIGRLVYVRMWLDLASWSSGPTGNAIITSLPFTTNSTSLNFPAVVIGYAATWDTDNTPGGGTADPDATFIYLRKRDSADARDNINTTVSANAMNGTENLTLTMVYETA